jgi:hypothetical protein
MGFQKVKFTAVTSKCLYLIDRIELCNTDPQFTGAKPKSIQEVNTSVQAVK